MNNSPNRGQQPMQRRVVNRPGQANTVQRGPQPRPQPQAQQSRPVAESVYFEEDAPATPTPRPSVSRHQLKQKSSKWYQSKWTKIGVAVAVLGIGGLLVWGFVQNSTTGIKSGQYQAVFFSNGQVYFGKLHSFNAESMRLTDVYYLQNQSSDGSTSSDNPQSSSGGNAKLIKLGDEIHAPDDEMIIPKSQIQFYENIKADGQVAQLMKKYEAGN